MSEKTQILNWVTLRKCPNSYELQRQRHLTVRAFMTSPTFFTTTLNMFVSIQYGENEELIINPNCRQLIFMGYLREKCQYNSKAFIDLIDENGKLANIHKVEKQENVLENFEDRLMYIPVMLEKSGDDRNPYKMIRPLLTDWEKRFPQLERKIKILTGELKRKKSPVNRGLLDSRGKGIDRKPSSSHRSDGPGRSSSSVGRPSSIMNQSGRSSVQASGRKSIVGNSDKLGFKNNSKGSKPKRK